VLEEGCADGSFRSDVDVVISSIFVLSILNAIERWYRLSGRIDRGALVDATYGFVIEGVT
ncbi:MAG: TetR family transcriptional regulator, partial [Acidimicrobiia bacterium]